MLGAFPLPLFSKHEKERIIHQEYTDFEPKWPFIASDKGMVFYYFLIDFIPLVQTVSLHLLLLTAQQEHFEFDADEFTINTIMESSIKLSFS